MIELTNKLKKLIQKYGIAEAAYRMRKRYETVREAAVNGGFIIKRGRRKNSKNIERDDNIFALRNEGLTLQAIGDKYKLTRERVRQILVKFSEGPR
jgi:Mor family transcriptional regulator